MQRKQNPAHEKDPLLSIMEKAMAEELKARDFYKKMSKQLEDKAARNKFDIMSDTENRHYEIIKKWYEKHYGQSAKTKKLNAGRALKVKKPGEKASYEDIIKIIIDAEERAHEFYKAAAKKTKDKQAKELFKKLSDMERAHADQFKDEYRIVTGPSLQCAEEDIPWMLEV